MQEAASYYDVLELTPDASAAEIREAYLRLKNAYARDSIASYSLISAEDTVGIVRQIEEAFQVLSHPEKRREYDRHFKARALHLSSPTAPPPAPGKIVSIDRTPPMETASSDDLEALMTPRTDDTARDRPLGAEPHSIAPAQSGAARLPADRVAELEASGEWTGSVLREVRERLGMSLEEIADSTRISKIYLSAIENDHFAKLPASVFVRGFVGQIARILGLPHEKVANAYVARYRSSGQGRG